MNQFTFQIVFAVMAALYCTGWLKNTPPDKMQFLNNRERFFITTFLDLYGRDPATMLKLPKQTILVFSKVVAI